MISLGISASSSHVDLMSTPPSRRYQASIYSTHSYTHPHRHGYRSSRNTSLEQLVPKRRVRFESEALPANRTTSSKPRMSSNGSENGGVTIEPKKSYGIGGAGNIRRPSDVIYPVRLNADGTRRRSSVWSSSPDGKRTGIMDRLFRRSTSNGASERDQDENAIARR